MKSKGRAPLKNKSSGPTKQNGPKKARLFLKTLTRTQADRAAHRIMKLAEWHSDDKPNEWEMHYEIILLATELVGDDPVHDIALPIDRSMIQKQKVHENWELPPFRLDKSGLQSTLYKIVGEEYNRVTASHIKKYGTRHVAKWEAVKEAWSRIGAFFFHYWCLFPEYEKEEAHAKALAVGEASVKEPGDFEIVMEQLVEKKRLEFHTQQVQLLLCDVKRHEPEEHDDDAFLGAYFRYNDEEKANKCLQGFFAAKGFKCGHYKDMSKASKAWLATADDEDKKEFKLFGQIYSKKEVFIATVQRKKQMKKQMNPDKPETSGIEWSYVPLDATRIAELDGAKLSPEVLKALNRLMSRHRSIPSPEDFESPEYNAMEALDLKVVSTDRAPGYKYVWLVPNASDDMELLKKLFPKEKLDERFLSLDDVNDTLDKGMLTKAVEQVHRDLEALKSNDRKHRKKGTQLRTLLQHINNVSWARDAYRALFEEQERRPKTCCVCLTLLEKFSPLVTCGACRKQIHYHCGIFSDDLRSTVDWRQTAQCLQCCYDIGNNPPLLWNDEKCFSFHKPGHKWQERHVESYVLLMNFVNRVHGKGVVTPAFKAMIEVGEPKRNDDNDNESIALTKSAAKVVVGLLMHDLEKMGDDHVHVEKALFTWLPALFRMQISMYLTGFYEILTETTIPMASGEISSVTCEEIDSICNKVACWHIQEERMILEKMKQGLLEIHRLDQLGNSASATSLSHLVRFRKNINEIYLITQAFIMGNDADILGRHGQYFITQKSFQTLAPRTWLDDATINFYLAMRNGHGFFAFPNYFYQQLIQLGHEENDGIYNYQDVRKYYKMTPECSIFRLKLLGIPININESHWIFVLVDSYKANPGL